MPATTVSYLDAWAPDDSADRFPEIEQSEFSPPDIICDFNAEGLAPINDDSQDFAIASHVLEHLANPLRMLCELHRVVRPGGAVLIFLPDRHNTFDKDREPTPLDHLVEEFEAGVTEVDDAHIEDFISFTATHQGGGPAWDRFASPTRNSTSRACRCTSAAWPCSGCAGTTSRCRRSAGS